MRQLRRQVIQAFMSAASPTMTSDVLSWFLGTWKEVDILYLSFIVLESRRVPFPSKVSYILQTGLCSLSSLSRLPPAPTPS